MSLMQLGNYGFASNKVRISYYWRSHSSLILLVTQVNMAPPVIRHCYLITGGALVT